MRKINTSVPGIVFLLAIILAACSGGPTPIEPVLQQAATQPPSEAGITVEAVTATSQPTLAATSTANVGESAPPTAIYEDEVAGFVLDYPAGWQIVDVAPQIKASANNYTVSFLSWQPAAGGTEGIPEGGTKVDVSARPGPVATLQEAAGEWKRQLTADPGQTLLSETTLTTDGGLQGIRWEVQSPFARSMSVMTVVGGRPILLSGQGDEAIVEWMAKSLRPSSQTGSGEGPATQTATPEPQSALPLLGSSGAPPSTGCVVYQSGRVRDEELPTVHAAPDPASDLMGQLGRDRWANGLQRQEEWIEIALGNGQAGWIKGTGVGLTEECAFEVPLIMNRGAPANDRCLAMVGEPGGHTVDVRSAPGEDQARVAILVNWAEVRQSVGGWHEIEIPQGGTGWVEGSQVVLSAGCE